MTRKPAVDAKTRAVCVLRLLFAGMLVLSLSANASAARLNVAVISDMNGAYGATHYEPAVAAAVARIIDLKPDLVISTGDMVAGQRRPHLERPQIERMWESFHTHVTEPLAAAGIPLAITPGNHDGSGYEGFERERAIFSEQWTPRAPDVEFVDRHAYPFHYAFAAGDVLFIAMDATTVGRLSDEQMTWLEMLLARQGSNYRRRVVFSHLPLWPFSHGRESEHIGDPALHRLLVQADVDLYLSGHHHAFYPGSRDGVAFVGQACLGAGPRRLLGADGVSPKAFTLLTFDGGLPRVTVFTGPTFTESTDWRSLPPSIHSDVADLVRADLAGTIRPGTTIAAPLVEAVNKCARSPHRLTITTGEFQRGLGPSLPLHRQRTESKRETTLAPPGYFRAANSFGPWRSAL